MSPAEATKQEAEQDASAVEDRIWAVRLQATRAVQEASRGKRKHGAESELATSTGRCRDEEACLLQFEAVVVIFVHRQRRDRHGNHAWSRAATQARHRIRQREEVAAERRVSSSLQLPRAAFEAAKSRRTAEDFKVTIRTRDGAGGEAEHPHHKGEGERQRRHACSKNQHKCSLSAGQ